VPEYLLSISDSSETATSHMASVTNSQNVLPISEEPSLSPLNNIFPSYTSPEKNIFLQILEKDQSNTENTEKIFN